MHKIILCRGIQGSGKSTWAREWAEKYPAYRIRFNYDDLRNMFGQYWVPSREVILKRARMAIVTEAMENGYDIVIDNMNLNPNEVHWYEGVINEFNERRPSNHYVLEFQDFKTPVEECIRRDSLRDNPIGAAIIMSTYERYKDFYDAE